MVVRHFDSILDPLARFPNAARRETARRRERLGAVVPSRGGRGRRTNRTVSVSSHVVAARQLKPYCVAACARTSVRANVALQTDRVHVQTSRLTLRSATVERRRAQLDDHLTRYAHCDAESLKFSHFWSLANRD